MHYYKKKVNGEQLYSTESPSDSFEIEKDISEYSEIKIYYYNDRNNYFCANTYTVNGKINTTITSTFKDIYNGKYYECIETAKLTIEGKTANLTNREYGLTYENSTIFGYTNCSIRVEKIVGYK